eukprot:14145412-Ditylum_brightwellii.AAC.1
MQPNFAKSNWKFTGVQTIQSASVATGYSGNERAVNHTKQSELLKHSVSKRGNLKRINKEERGIQTEPIILFNKGRGRHPHRAYHLFQQRKKKESKQSLSSLPTNEEGGI